MNREIYGILIGFVTLLCLFLPLYLFLPFLGLLSFLMAREISRPLGISDVAPLAFLGVLLFYFSPAIGILSVSIFSLIYGYNRWSIEDFFKSFFLLSYTSFFPSYLAFIKEESTYLLLIFFLSVWANDVSAYYVGKKLGKTTLFPKISPKKTFEGFVGGLVFGSLVMVLLADKPILPMLFLAPLVLSIGVVGDYFKSFIKRQLGIKDFSRALGEHGGFVDRFDAAVFAAPVFYTLIFRI